MRRIVKPCRNKSIPLHLDLDISPNAGLIPLVPERRVFNSLWKSVRKLETQCVHCLLTLYREGIVPCVEKTCVGDVLFILTCEVDIRSLNGRESQRGEIVEKDVVNQLFVVDDLDLDIVVDVGAAVVSQDRGQWVRRFEFDRVGSARVVLDTEVDVALLTLMVDDRHAALVLDHGWG